MLMLWRVLYFSAMLRRHDFAALMLLTPLLFFAGLPAFSRRNTTYARVLLLSKDFALCASAVYFVCARGVRAYEKHMFYTSQRVVYAL